MERMIEREREREREYQAEHGHNLAPGVFSSGETRR